MCWFHGQRCSFLPLPDWNFVFYHECLHCCMWNVKDLSQTLTAYLFPFDATLYKTRIYLSSRSSFSWLPVPIFCTSRLLRSELRRQTLLARTVDIFFFVVFTMMPCIFSCKFWSLPCFFFTFLSESFYVLTSLFCVQISGICISSKYYAWFCPSYLWYNSGNP